MSEKLGAIWQRLIIQSHKARDITDLVYSLKECCIFVVGHHVPRSFYGLLTARLRPLRLDTVAFGRECRIGEQVEQRVVEGCGMPVSKVKGLHLKE